jgi:hypothetical protein
VQTKKNISGNRVSSNKKKAYPAALSLKDWDAFSYREGKGGERTASYEEQALLLLSIHTDVLSRQG